MTLKHLFPKKVNMNQCFGIKEHCGKHECKYLQRIFINGGVSRLLFCSYKDVSLKHSDKEEDCESYEEQEKNDGQR